MFSSARTTHFTLALARSLSSLALILWMGGLVFFGALAAPAIFPLSRQAGQFALGPQIAGVILHRFAFVTVICGALLMVGWWWEGRILRPSGSQRRLWRGQGAVAGASLFLALLLTFGLLPRVETGQRAILPLIVRAESGQKLTPDEAAQRAEFDKGHRRYQSLARLNLLFLLALFVLSAWRAALETTFSAGRVDKPEGHSENPVLK